MQKIVLPYIEEVFVNKETPPAQFDQAYNFILNEKKYSEGYFRLETADRVHFLFISDGYPYAAGIFTPHGFKSVQIRDFFSTYLQTRPPVLSFYRTDEILTKSIIVLFQHTPTMQVTTDLVDVEEILDKIKTKGVDSILAIRDQNQSSLILCQQGIPSSTYLIEPGEAQQEGTPTDQMLVYIYSRSGSRNITIDVYHDIIITKAPDASIPPDGFSKPIPDFYTRPQPDLHVMLGEQSITKYRIKGATVKIGRVPENDIVINNLGVSRRHSEIIEEGGRYYLKDLGSVNGSYVNGQKVEKVVLNDKDEVLIGKHKIIFLHSEVQGGAGKSAMQESQTVMMDPTTVQKMRQAASIAPAKIILADGQTFAVVKSKTVLGNGSAADIKVADKTIAPEQIQILRDENGYKLVHLSNTAATYVNGDMVADSVQLSEDSTIQIGQSTLSFKVSE